MEAAADLVARAVRQADPDAYLSTLYAPEPKRRPLLALRAFDAEIAAVRDRTSQPMTGELRLQWWRDAITLGDDQADAGNPLLSELRRAVQLHGLPVSALDTYLEARIFDLYDDPMPTRADLEGYAGETAAAMVQLCAMVLDPPAAAHASEASGHAGCAQVVLSALRLLPIHRARGQCFAPLDLLAAAGCSREEWLAGQQSAAVERAFAAMLALARDHLGAFRRAALAMPATLRPAYLPMALSPRWLDRLQRAGPSGGMAAGPSPLHRHWLLFRYAARGWR
ncbi:MAG: phytoene/squalene synthase family protein [Rhizobiaceae bacterium]|nr:phytoene/squalene synthase family protein [Rhizobiaceae bacterium]